MVDCQVGLKVNAAPVLSSAIHSLIHMKHLDILTGLCSSYAVMQVLDYIVCEGNTSDMRMSGRVVQDSSAYWLLFSCSLKSNRFTVIKCRIPIKRVGVNEALTNTPCHM